MIRQARVVIGHTAKGRSQVPQSDELHTKAAAAAFIEELFDRIPDVVFFIKDTHGRYVVVNRTLVERCGADSKADVLGHTTVELFPSPLGERYLEQDLEVCLTGRAIDGRLELHLVPGRGEGWCLTDKIPIRDSDGAVIGVAGVSRDLRMPPAQDECLGDVADALAFLKGHFDQPIRVEDLAARAGMSAYQLNRRVRAIYGLTASQLIAKTRIDAATDRLNRSNDAIGDIAIACGYCDQSAFTRHFRRVTGLTPSQYRDTCARISHPRYSGPG
jgi:AraC-like DNA-binding protein